MAEKAGNTELQQSQSDAVGIWNLTECFYGCFPTATSQLEEPVVIRNL